MCPNFGTPKTVNVHLEQMENLLFSGVPILKHIAVYSTAIVKFRFVSGLGDNLSR